MMAPGPPAGPPAPQRLPRPRKKRTVYLKAQLRELRKHFARNRYPSPQERLALAARLHLDKQQFRVWFKNLRARHTRLQGLPIGRVRGARSAPQGPGTPASDSIPVPDPFPVPFAFPSPFPVPTPVPVPDPAPVLAPGRSRFPGSISVYSIHQNWWDPELGSQDHVPAAQALVPAPDLAWPQNSFSSDFSPRPMLAPYFTALLLPQDPLEEPSFPLMSGSTEDGDLDLRRLLDL
ncbi:tetra-peptide repeat homeobox protein 1-like [Lontra canadensis]|uniref:tetra-peptide repeat homeobox protein 1-like n=1 Tax=Lontra canadensis TaxID=76717 RepID=UPI0013F2D6E2|nr:tetra-peptide repeat homeobox protein 1-like [Lontra canadensis]